MRFHQFLAVMLGLCVAATAQAKDKKVVPVAPPSTIAPPLLPENTWNLDLSTGGRVTIQLRPDKAPNTVARIKTLTRRGFYDGLIFHRVIDGFMAQGGDPKGTGEGGSELPDLVAEFNDLPHVRGTVAAARSAADDSANSQFYIMFQPNLKLDNRYTVFGRVVSGMPYVDALERGEPPANPSRIVKATIAGPDTEASALSAVATPTAAAPQTKAEIKAAAKEAKAAEKARAKGAKAEAKAAKDAGPAAAKAAEARTKAAAKEAKATEKAQAKAAEETRKAEAAAARQAAAQAEAARRAETAAAKQAEKDAKAAQKAEASRAAEAAKAAGPGSTAEAPPPAQ